MPDPEDPRQSLTLTEHEARVIRLYLERVAKRLDNAPGSSAYRSSMNFAAKIVRDSKPD